MTKDISTLSSSKVESRAEALMAMDVLMKHVNDENVQEYWMANGVPDGAPKLRMTNEQLEYYEQFVDIFEEIVRVFARTVKRVCFKTTYEPKVFC